MQQHPRITYTPRSDVTPEDESGALASVYAFVLRSQEERKAAEQSGRDSAQGDVDDRAETSIP